MADDAVDFASLMCSRLCHDLLSPVGSFGNGLELLADEPDAAMRAKFIELLESSSKAAINRLKFFRLAFGSSGGYGEAIAAGDIVEAVSGLVAEGRSVAINWIGDGAPVPKPAARILLLLAQTVVEALVRGGQIDMAVEAREGSLELAIRGSGDRVVLDPASEGLFASARNEATPKTVGIALARRLAQGYRGDIMLSRPAANELVVGAIVTPAANR